MNRLLKILSIAFLTLFVSCSSDSEKNAPSLEDDAAMNPRKDAEIQRYNLELKKKESVDRFPCDTIAVMEHILQNFPGGTYLMELDKATLYSEAKSALIYYTDQDRRNYVFAVIASSRQGERLIEIENLIGYEQSFIDLDSTELGTPIISLVLFECYENSLLKVWESVIPSHGGFNNFSLNTWNVNRTKYIQANFYYARGIGHFNYNFFLVDGIRNQPHLILTYNGVDFKRTLANLNNDNYPDYYEHLFVSTKDRISAKDSIAFLWNDKLNLYVNKRNPKQTRPY